MKSDFHSKFATRSTSHGQPSLTTNLISWLENGFLLALTLSLILAKYIPFLNSNSITTTFLRYYTFAFVALQSIFRAINLYNTVLNDTSSDIYSKRNLYRVLAFTGAFCVAMMGIIAFNKDVESVPDVLKAVGMSVFPYSLVEMFDNNASFMDFTMNGVYAVLLSLGLISIYLGKNMMGVFCVTALVLKGLYNFVRNKTESRVMTVGREYAVTIGLGLITVIIMLVCHYKNVSMVLPKFNEIFNKAVSGSSGSS